MLKYLKLLFLILPCSLPQQLFCFSIYPPHIRYHQYSLSPYPTSPIQLIPFSCLTSSSAPFNHPLSCPTTDSKYDSVGSFPAQSFKSPADPCVLHSDDSSGSRVPGATLVIVNGKEMVVEVVD